MARILLLTALLSFALCLRLQTMHDYYLRYSCIGDGTTFHCQTYHGLMYGDIKRSGKSLFFIELPDFPLTKCESQGYCWRYDGKIAAIADGDLTAASGHINLIGPGNVQVGSITIDGNTINVEY